jgi:hypothetical protein
VGSLSQSARAIWVALALIGCRHSSFGPRGAAPAVSEAPRSCMQPIPLRVGSPMRASTRTGGDSLRASCLRGAAPECVFELEASTRSELRVALETGAFDGALALYERGVSGSAPRELRCVDDLPSGDVHHSRLDATLPAGSYLLAVDGANGEAGEFELFAELEPLASIATACAAAAPLHAAAALRDSTRGGTNLFSATCGGGGQGPDHVHVLALDKPARVRIRQQAEYDGSLYLRASCEDASSELVCNDDFQTNARSMIAARLPAGTYYVFSDSYSREQSGDYTVTLERFDEPAARSSAALCTELAQQPAGAGQRELDTLYGTFAFAGSCGGKDTPEVALTLRVDAPTTLSAKLEDAELNAVMYLRRGCGESSNEVACFVAPRIDRPANEAEMSSPALVVPLERGVYTLVIDGFEASDIGAATLRLLFTP